MLDLQKTMDELVKRNSAEDVIESLASAFALHGTNRTDSSNKYIKQVSEIADEIAEKNS
jgi:hypothetical protein